VPADALPNCRAVALLPRNFRSQEQPGQSPYDCSPTTMSTTLPQSLRSDTKQSYASALIYLFTETATLLQGGEPDINIMKNKPKLAIPCYQPTQQPQWANMHKQAGSNLLGES
jgi:hypothetical protein